jgi:RepB DNA-primase from phage plasmid
MESSRDSGIIASRVAMDQLKAMSAVAFDIGVKRTDGTMLLRQGWGAKQVLKSLLWLRRENLNCGHIYVRPAGVHGLSLVDDLKVDARARMKAEGSEPAAVVEASPGICRPGSNMAKRLTRRTAQGQPGGWPNVSAATPAAPTGGISGGSQGLLIRSLTGAWLQGCSRLHDCSKPAGKSTSRRRCSLRKSKPRWRVRR